MAERKYTGTDAELLRLKRKGLSLRAIAAEVGIGKSVVGARIARAEAAEGAGAESPASTQAISGAADRRAASATTSSDPHAAGPINIRAELERIARTGKNDRERLGALQALARMDGIDAGDGPKRDGPDIAGSFVKPGTCFWLVQDEVAKAAGLVDSDAAVVLWRSANPEHPELIFYFPRRQPTNEEPE